MNKIHLPSQEVFWNNLDCYFQKHRHLPGFDPALQRQLRRKTDEEVEKSMKRWLGAGLLLATFVGSFAYTVLLFG
jgi:hypothetical protein